MQCNGEAFSIYMQQLKSVPLYSIYCPRIYTCQDLYVTIKLNRTQSRMNNAHTKKQHRKEMEKRV